MAKKTRIKTGYGTTVGATTLDLCEVKIPTNGAVVMRSMAIGSDVADRTASVVHDSGGGGGVSVGGISALGTTYGGTNKSLSLTTADVQRVSSGGYLVLRVTGVAGRTIEWQGSLMLAIV